jgi:hypothetical protein
MRPSSADKECDEMAVMGVAKFERFFRRAAGLDVHKNDLKRYNDFVNQKLYDLFVMARGTAKANDRDVIQPRDLPITKGLQDSMHRFRELDEEIELQPLLDQIAARPPLEIAVHEDTDARLPEVAGGVSFALARVFKIVYPKKKSPSSEDWETVFEVFDQLI